MRLVLHQEVSSSAITIDIHLLDPDVDRSMAEPILNASFKGGEGEGRGPTIEPDFHFILDRVGRWSLDDVGDHDLNGSLQRSDSASLPPSLNPM